MQARQRLVYTLLQEDQRPVPDLPQELIADILSRLPVKSILRFRCVSKSWLCLISSPHFIKSHLTISTKVNNQARHGLLLAPIDAPTELYTCSLYSVLYQRSPVNAESVQLPLQSKYPRLSFVGCCNGLVCISEGSRDLILFNPSTRKSKILPNSGIDAGKFKHMTYGFGYDEIPDDYKVVAIGYFCPYGMACQTIVKVYSLRTNSWKNIQGYEGGFISSCSGVFVNGALHWLVVSEDGSSFSSQIVSLNLATETYGEILLPDYEKGNVALTPGVLEGNLCVFYNYYEVKFDVWVMKEYGLKESWNKLAGIPYSVNFKGRASPLFVSEAGEILLKHDYSLMLYNEKDDIFTNRHLQMQSANYPGATAVYTESLVSPHIDELGTKTCAQ